jgi:hypothetical protein
MAANPLAAPDAWDLLADLATVAGSWDRSRAAPAARAAARIARQLGPDDAIRGDLPDDALAVRANAWLALARRRDRWADVRVHALEVAARLADARRATSDDAGPGFDLAGFLADPDPEVRRAACELTPVPVPPDQHAALATALAEDTEPAVAIAAAQALCGDLADRRDPRPILDALGNRGIARLRGLLTEAPLGDVPAPALVDAARCLRADAAPESLAALRALVARAPATARALLSRPLR